MAPVTWIDRAKGPVGEISECRGRRTSVIYTFAEKTTGETVWVGVGGKKRQMEEKRRPIVFFRLGHYLSVIKKALECDVGWVCTGEILCEIDYVREGQKIFLIELVSCLIMGDCALYLLRSGCAGRFRG